MLRSLIGTGAVLLLAVSCAHAADDSPAYTQCMDTASSTSLMSTCIQTETQAQDARLNQAYKQLMGKLDAQQKKGLREIQRSWMAYRDANCSFHGSLDNGTLSRVNATMCVKDLTRDRAAELEQMANPEG
ncbi:lysozyme inhibitor LprI family protein [Pseudomonas sp. RP23018S]|uniref:lysozyme inhibitor LprI family protein n=1 Tax=Pseudomonas sp. RP23018S TaxID=3096037 RepID=UPI002ACA7DDD|nr:lysozyme inhibitor LprI family protein [Pseudomonas sp. RP23018S]MDZ5603313.1 lysozyme inhibitor LprI family protein [Pseudomonas sp. RP23018S]